MLIKRSDGLVVALIGLLGCGGIAIIDPDDGSGGGAPTTSGSTGVGAGILRRR